MVRKVVCREDVSPKARVRQDRQQLPAGFMSLLVATLRSHEQLSPHTTPLHRVDVRVTTTGCINMLDLVLSSLAAARSETIDRTTLAKTARICHNTSDALRQYDNPLFGYNALRVIADIRTPRCRIHRQSQTVIKSHSSNLPRQSSMLYESRMKHRAESRQRTPVRHLPLQIEPR